MIAIAALLQDAAMAVRADPLLPAEIFLLLFVTLGPPLKTPAVFLQATHMLEPAQARSLAFKAFGLAVFAVIAGGFIGASIAQNWHVNPATLTLAGGLVFLLVSLQSVMSQYHPSPVPTAGAASSPAPPKAFQVAVPMIVTPYGLAAVIILLGNSDSASRTLLVVGLALLVMVLHLLAMLSARPIMRTIGPLPLQLFGVIVGVLTVALSLQIILGALRQLSVLPGVAP